LIIRLRTLSKSLNTWLNSILLQKSVIDCGMGWKRTLRISQRERSNFTLFAGMKWALTSGRNLYKCLNKEFRFMSRNCRDPKTRKVWLLVTMSLIISNLKKQEQWNWWILISSSSIEQTTTLISWIQWTTKSTSKIQSQWKWMKLSSQRE
jgi:hypothetical protein